VSKNRKTISRRQFLLTTNYFFFGGLFGLNSFSKVLASESRKNEFLFQPRIALIIDDIGYSPSRARRFLDLGLPITYSILPRFKYSNDLAVYIHKEGHDVMLHQPMEPYNPTIDPGPGALYVGDKQERVVRILEENISGIPFAAGVNNHMGSRFTECEHEMNQTLNVIRKKDLFFIDSLTTNHSIAYSTAKKLHMITAFRNIFLDNSRDESAIIRQLERLKRHAWKYGGAIGIGHPHVETARAMGKFFKGLTELDCSLVHISDILKT